MCTRICRLTWLYMALHDFTWLLHLQGTLQMCISICMYVLLAHDGGEKKKKITFFGTNSYVQTGMVTNTRKEEWPTSTNYPFFVTAEEGNTPNGGVPLLLNLKRFFRSCVAM